MNSHIWPPPQQLESLGSDFCLPHRGKIQLGGGHPLLDLGFRCQRLLQSLGSRQYELNFSDAGDLFAVRLSLRVPKESVFPEQGYELCLQEEGIDLQAQSLVGLFHGLMSLKQLLRVHGNILPSLRIVDWPDLLQRGILLDVSRDKVPELATLFELVEQWAEWKFNQLQLYTEHTFAYSRHRNVWDAASPYTAEDILRLERHCQEHFIELIPNQNSFGHLNRWLRLPEYQHLAECPHGFTWPDGRAHAEPFSLNPLHPQTFPFLEELFDELLPNFQSPLFNIGGDETLDLGLGQSRSACDSKGKGRVYLEFLQRLGTVVAARGRRMQCWGDIVQEHPELIPELPDMVALEWGYEANHPFDSHCQRLQESQIEFQVCSGTSSWRSLTGRTENMLKNIHASVTAAHQYGGKGMLLTDWGDCGHWQTLPLSYPGWLAGAAWSWKASAPVEDQLAEALDLHVFGDASQRAGEWLLEFGRLEQQTGRSWPHSTIFFHWLFQQPTHRSFQGLDKGVLGDLLEELQARRQQLQRLNPSLPKSDWLLAELQCMVDMTEHATQRAHCFAGEHWGEALERRTLATTLQRLLVQYRHLWCQRNRIGGLPDSTALFEIRLEEYRTGELNRDYQRFF